jgi:D-alanyl-lipoteichoic acid acyltransferase DltB (MBOAT superfamily)
MEQASLPPAASFSRTQVLVRLLYTVLFLILLGITVFLIKLSIAFQYILLLITLKPSEPVRRVANQLAVYAYRLLRYLTLNDNVRPFPFSEFPQEMEPAESEVRFE